MTIMHWCFLATLQLFHIPGYLLKMSPRSGIMWHNALCLTGHTSIAILKFQHVLYWLLLVLLISENGLSMSDDSVVLAEDMCSLILYGQNSH